MNSNWLFYLGFGLDLLLLLISASNLFIMNTPMQGLGGENIPPADGLAPIGRVAVWLIPLVLLGMIAGAWWLRSNGKLAAANIVIWIPALPMLIGLLIWGGLALLFLIAR